jgi:hypothetical protein
MNAISATGNIINTVADQVSADPAQNTQSQVATALLSDAMDIQKDLVNGLLASLGKGQNINTTA